MYMSLSRPFKGPPPKCQIKNRKLPGWLSRTSNLKIPKCVHLSHRRRAGGIDASHGHRCTYSGGLARLWGATPSHIARKSRFGPIIVRELLGGGGGTLVGRFRAISPSSCVPRNPLTPEIFSFSTILEATYSLFQRIPFFPS